MNIRCLLGAALNPHVCPCNTPVQTLVIPTAPPGGQRADAHGCFGRAGGEAMAIAIRIARAATGRDMVAFCGYHSWHDWCLSAHLGATTALDGYLLPGFNTKGVPRELTGLMHPFHFNKLDEIETIVAEHGERLAAIMMEPVRSTEPDPAFIGGIRAQTVWQYRARRPHLLSAAPLLSRRGLGRGHVSGPASFAHYA